MRPFINIAFLIAACITAFILYKYLYPDRKITYISHNRPALFSNLLNQKKIQKIKLPQKGALLGISLHKRDYNYLSSLENTLGKHFAIVSIYQAWGDQNNNFDFEWANTLKDQQSIPLISWEPWEAIAGYDRPENKVYQKKFLLKNINEGKFDNYIRQYARDIAAYNHPVIICFAHEMNSNWYPWGSKFNTPQEFIAAWHYIHHIFKQEGATNATWLWSPNEIYTDANVPFADDILKFYPGEQYVDIVGFSSFNWAGHYKNNIWREPEIMFTQTVKELKTLNKPIIITETASADYQTNIQKARWISSLASYIKNDPAIKAIIWFNAIDNGINWEIKSTPQSTKSFNNSFDKYFIEFY